MKGNGVLEREIDMPFFGRECPVVISIKTDNAECELNEQIIQARQNFIDTFQEKLAKLPNLLLDYYLEHYEYINEWFPMPEDLDREHITTEKLLRLIQPTDIVLLADGTCGMLCDVVWNDEWGLAIILSGEEPVITEDTGLFYCNCCEPVKNQ